MSLSREALSDIPQWAYGIRKLVVFSGAGISTESGIPDFRGPTGAWTLSPGSENKHTYDAFMRDPELRRSYWKSRAEHEVWTAEPNAGHLAVAALADSGIDTTVVTQNTDGLQQRAGTPAEQVVELHGTMHETLCVDCDDRTPTTEIVARIVAGEADPACRRCGGILKTASTMFGQTVSPSVFGRARDAMTTCDLVLAVGSSLTVEPPASLCAAAIRSGAALVIVNQGATPYDGVATALIAEQLGEVLPRIARQLTEAAKAGPADGTAGVEEALPAGLPVRPSHLLRASARTAAFQPPDGELDGLSAWCAEGTGARALLLSGPAGAGKSRLALELIDRLAATGEWDAYVVTGDDPLPASERSVLAVVDDADVRQDRAGRILTDARDRPAHRPVRVLLLAREPGDWWGRMRAEGDGAVRLGVPADAGPDQVVAAVRDYTAALTAAGITAVAPDEAGAASWAASWAGESPLPGAVQASVLAHLLGATEDAPARLVEQELAALRRAAAEAGLELPAAAVAGAAVAAVLCGAADEDAAVAVLESVPGLADAATRTAVARWLHDVGEPGPGAFWDESLPGALAEDVVAAVATTQFLLRTLGDAAEGQDRRALTVLARAARTRPVLRDRLADLLALLPGLSPAAVDAALGGGYPAPLAAALTALVSSFPLPVDLLHRVPPGTTALGEFPVALAQNLVTAYELRRPSEPVLRGLTEMLIELSDRLRDAGRAEESLAAARRSAETAGRLAEPLDYATRAAECVRRALDSATVR